jgi:predicted nicotinamide N-methyase
VWQTDYEAGVLEIARRNAEQNDVTGIHTFVADWRAWQDGRQYDLIIGADILYERAMWPLLGQIFMQNLRPAGWLWLTDPGRKHTLHFAAALEKAGWKVELALESVQLPLANAKLVEVTFFALQRSDDVRREP